MVRFRRTSAALMVILGVSTGAREAAAASSLGIAGNYGEFVFGDSTRTNTDSRGPVAVQGAANFTDFSIADSPLSPSGPSAANLVVGGNLSWTRGTLYRGYGVVGGTIAVPNVSTPNGSIAPGASPIDFDSVKADLLAISQAQYDSSQPFVAPVFGSLTFDNDAGDALKTFNVDAGVFAGAHTYTVKGSADSTVIINVIGLATDFNNAGVFLEGGITSSRVLWNFVDATSLTISGIGVNGTILAINADVKFENAQINGSLIAASVYGSGSGETHIDQGGRDGGIDTRFTGEISTAAVPEPTAVAMLGTAAVVGLGLAARRRAGR